jgi:hypothetical protein
MYRSVYSVSLCCSVYCLCLNVYCTATATGISGHFSTTLRIFRAFSSVVRHMPGYNSIRRGTARTSHFLLLCMFYSVYCLCVNVYCTAATGCQPNCSLQICDVIDKKFVSSERLCRT